MPLSSKDDVETIIEKPKEDEEREDEGYKEDKENLKKKLINLNKNIENQKLFYTHLNPQIIDNTKKYSNYNSIRRDELQNINQDGNLKVPDTLGKNNENSKEAEEDEEMEEVEDEEEEADDEQSDMNTERKQKEKKKTNLSKYRE